MIINWQGRDWELEFTDFTVKQGEVIEAEAGVPVGKWLDMFGGEGFGADHPEFLRTMKIIYWLMLSQNGETVPIGAVDFPVLKFGMAFMEGAAAEQAKDAAAAAKTAAAQLVVAPDPTQAGPSPATPSPALSTPLDQVPDGLRPAVAG